MQFREQGDSAGKGLYRQLERFDFEWVLSLDEGCCKDFHCVYSSDDSATTT